MNKSLWDVPPNSAFRECYFPVGLVLKDADPCFFHETNGNRFGQKQDIKYTPLN